MTNENPAAALARKRWAKLKTKRSRTAATAPAREAAAAALTPESRAANARKITPAAAKARAEKAWKTRRKNAKSP